jgi:hypothetical protein
MISVSTKTLRISVFISLGANLHIYSYSTVAISISFFPETGDEFGLFVGVIGGSDIIPAAMHEFYSVHDLWVYDISLSVVDSSWSSILAFGDSRKSKDLRKSLSLAQPSGW